ncbi:MAG: glycosyltransferase [Bacilli bacterium]|jgi:hypothetical protein
MNEFADILIIAYNRPYHIRQTVESLLRCNNAENTNVIIYIDGAKDNDNDRINVNKVKEYCYSITGFKSIRIVERSHNRGLSNNIINAVTTELSIRDVIIVLEDDIVVSTGFIDYMNSALVFYYYTHVFSISAYSPNIKFYKNYRFSTYASPRFCSIGWATWKYKWNTIDWNISMFNTFIKSSSSRKAFNIGGIDLTPMLFQSIIRKLDSWAIRATFEEYVLHNVTIYPRESLVRHIGNDNSGTNSKNSKRLDSKIVDNIDDTMFYPGTKSIPYIMKQFRQPYKSSIIRRIINFIVLRLYLIYIN